MNNKELNILNKSWNNYFNNDIKIEYDNNLSIDELFNNYLQKITNINNYELSDEICFCKKENTNYIISYVNNNKICTEMLNIRYKRKLFNLINNYSIIIVEGFPLSKDTAPDKIILRYELIRNIYTSNHTHFFNKDLIFSINDYNIFFTKIFINDLLTNKIRLNQLKFSSYLLNVFEAGMTIDEIVLKPNITISPYGRWYWTNTEKIQNSIKIRNKIYNKLIKYGKIMTIDLISGEPWILSQLTKSNTLKKLIKTRIKLNNNGNYELSDMLKNMMNIFIHSIETPETSYNWVVNENKNYNELELKLNCSILDIFSTLQNEFLWYNNHVIESYRQNLSVVELGRRIVNPSINIMSDKEIIKIHRKYLQGLVHDKILLISKDIYSNLGILPIFTIHDSVSYFINNHNENTIIEYVNKIAKKYKTPITIEIIEK